MRVLAATTPRVVLGLILLVGAACGTPSSSPTTSVAAPSQPAAASSAPAEAATVGEGEEWIVFHGVSYGLSLIRPDGTGNHVILGRPGDQVHPDWSPDGSQIAYVQQDQDSFEIWITDPLGVDPRPLLTKYPAELTGLFWDNPAWSPDGRQIAAIAYEGNPAEVFPARSVLVIIDVANEDIEVVGELESGLAHSFPRWSPDGNAFVIALDSFSDTEYLGGAIAIIRRTDSGWSEPDPITEVVPGPNADWHPTEDLVVYCDGVSTHPRLDESSNLFTIRPDGTEQIQITSLGPGEDRASQPSWTLDGRIIFNHHSGGEDPLGSIAFVSADGTGLEIAVGEATVGPGNHPRLRPVP